MTGYSRRYSARRPAALARNPHRQRLVNGASFALGVLEPTRVGIAVAVIAAALAGAVAAFVLGQGIAVVVGASIVAPLLGWFGWSLTCKALRFGLGRAAVRVSANGSPAAYVTSMADSMTKIDRLNASGAPLSRSDIEQVRNTYSECLDVYAHWREVRRAARPRHSGVRPLDEATARRQEARTQVLALAAAEFFRLAGAMAESARAEALELADDHDGSDYQEGLRAIAAVTSVREHLPELPDRADADDAPFADVMVLDPSHTRSRPRPRTGTSSGSGAGSWPTQRSATSQPFPESGRAQGTG